MALTLDDADRMISACDQNKIKLFVIKQNRFNLPVKKLKEAIDSGRFGKINLGTVRVRWSRDQSYYDQDKWRGTWALDGGVLANQASHHIDLLEWMLGEPLSVYAIAKKEAILEAFKTKKSIIGAVASIFQGQGKLPIVGAIIAGLAGNSDSIFNTSSIFGFLAISLAAVNIFGGFLVTQRMLAMYKKKKKDK